MAIWRSSICDDLVGWAVDIGERCSDRECGPKPWATFKATLTSFPPKFFVVLFSVLHGKENVDQNPTVNIYRHECNVINHSSEFLLINNLPLAFLLVSQLCDLACN